MKRVTKYFLFLLFLLAVSTCKRKTTIDVSVYNYALDEPVNGARVALVERKEKGSIYGGNASCNEIAHTTSDANGYCNFDKEKLRTGGSYGYFIVVTNAYGLEQYYPCEGKTSGFLSVGKSQKQDIDAGAIDAYIRIQYNNLLNPAQPGDSLIVSLSTIEYSTPKGIQEGGGGVFGAFPNYDINNPPNNPPVILLDPIKTSAQKLQRLIRKHKLGVITQVIDTIKIYPNQTTTVVINW